MSQRQIAQKQIEALILKFRQNEDSYKNGSYNETQLRREFLDPFFEALGWDVANKQGLAEQYKDVIHEDAIKVGEQTKAPDYSFRVGGQRKFFVEAKKPSVSIKEDIGPAYQIRRYSWSAKLPLAILSDFEELAIYDCRLKPKPADKASVGRVAFYTYDQYLEKFDEIYDLFSKEAVLKGAFDKFAQADARKKGTTEVDKEFLKDIEHWREILAKSIALRNDKLSNDDLNYAVQTIIDRIIFLRICEDRNLEASETLKGLLTYENVYKRLINLFKQADDRYNAGLFDFIKDQITTKLKIDDKVFEEIIGQMYYPASPYVFSQMPIEILGQVYEQFLGKVIRLTAGHHAKVEEKPEVRKAGGVYYTPQYIVDYIVKNTVGALLDPKSDPSPTSPRSGERLGSLTPKEIESIKILDPACGSGSFLIGAYKYLLEYHLNWYVNNEPKKYPKAVFTDGRGAWRLTTSEAKKILLNNIFGVDIDSQAVEVTKLSLLLKVLENESREGMEQQLKMFKERALPNIDGNIKCGNSLIGPDFYQGQLNLSPALPSRGGSKRGVPNEDGAKINPFDWEREFPEIMKRGGFDAVIGNPPYVRQEALGEFKDYFKANYKVFHGMADLYAYFIERGISLLRDNGIFTYIVANKWMRASYGEPLRRWLKQQNIVRIIDFGDLPVFQNATTYPCILSVAKGKAGGVFAATQVKTVEFVNLNEYVEQNKYKVRQAGLEDNGWSLSSEIKQKVLAKLRLNSIPLGDYVKGEVYLGVKTGLNEAFIIDGITKKKLIQEDPRSKDLIKPFLLGKDIKRYQNPAINQFIIFIPKGWTRNVSANASDKWLWFKKAYPAIVKHLEQFTEAAKKRQDQGEYWWELRSCDYYDKFETPKIIYPDLSIRGSFLLDEKGYLYSGNTTYIIPVNDKNLLGVLNSRAVTFFYKNLSSVFRGGYLRYFTQYVVQIPIPKDLVQNKTLKPFVEKLIALNTDMEESKNPNEKETLSRQIEVTDKQIDKLVYELYGLTEEEIKVVEGE